MQQVTEIYGRENGWGALSYDKRRLIKALSLGLDGRTFQVEVRGLLVGMGYG